MKQRIQERITELFGIKRRDAWEQDYPKALGYFDEEARGEYAKIEETLFADSTRLSRFAGRLTVSESFFLRHPEQFDQINRYIAASLLRTSETIRIWSAGCARGEEAYSVVISHLESGIHLDGGRLQIIATDISHDAVNKARKAIYTNWALRGVPKEIQQHYFSVLGDQLILKEQIRQKVQFEATSIQDMLRRTPPDSIDIVIFRNVAIYLTDQSLREIYSGFARILKPDGLLLIAPSDPRPEDAGLRLDSANSSVYHRRRHEAASIEIPDSDWLPQAKSDQKPTSSPPTRKRIVGPKRSNILPEQLRQPEPHNHRLEHRQAHEHTLPQEVTLTTASHMIMRAPNHPSGYLLRGRIHLDKGALDHAITDLGHASALVPGDRLAKFWLAMALHISDRVEDARKVFLELRSSLQKHRGDDLLEDGETPVSELLDHLQFLLAETA